MVSEQVLHFFAYEPSVRRLQKCDFYKEVVQKLKFPNNANKAMLTLTVNPRFGDMDILGHVNNIIPSHWFEHARTPLMRYFDPEMTLSKKTFPLIMAHTEYDFVGQMFFKEVTIKTWISRIGTKSFTIYHEAWQEDRLCVKGSAVIVHYDFNIEQTTPIPEDKKKLLEAHLLPKEAHLLPEETSI